MQLNKELEKGQSKKILVDECIRLLGDIVGTGKGGLCFSAFGPMAYGMQAALTVVDCFRDLHHIVRPPGSSHK